MQSVRSSCNITLASPKIVVQYTVDIFWQSFITTSGNGRKKLSKEEAHELDISFLQGVNPPRTHPHRISLTQQLFKKVTKIKPSEPPSVPSAAECQPVCRLFCDWLRNWWWVGESAVCNERMWTPLAFFLRRGRRLLHRVVDSPNPSSSWLSCCRFPSQQKDSILSALSAIRAPS